MNESTCGHIICLMKFGQLQWGFSIQLSYLTEQTCKKNRDASTKIMNYDWLIQYVEFLC